MNALQSRRRSDRGDSQLVTFVLVMPLLFMLVVTMIDVSIYFSNRAVIQQVARDGARQVAILGGDGTATTRTQIEATNGETAACNSVTNPAARSANQTQVECKVLLRYEDSGLTNVTIDRVDCGPSFTTAVGQPTYCDVDWTYGGVPGAVTSFLRGSDGAAPLQHNRTRVTGEAEVNMTGTAPVPR
jgi:Flp pilus assembly protein TadG